MKLALKNTRLGGGWSTRWIGEQTYLCRSAINNRRVIAIYVSIDALLHTVNEWEGQDRQVFWTDSSGEIYGAAGTGLYSFEKNSSLEMLDKRFMIMDRYDFLNGKFHVNLFEKKTAIYKQVSIYMAMMFITVFLLLFFTFYIKRNIQSELIVPMKGLSENMKKIQDGEYGLRIDE